MRESLLVLLPSMAHASETVPPLALFCVHVENAPKDVERRCNALVLKLTVAWTALTDVPGLIRSCTENVPLISALTVPGEMYINPVPANARPGIKHNPTIRVKASSADLIL